MNNSGHFPYFYVVAVALDYIYATRMKMKDMHMAIKAVQYIVKPLNLHYIFLNVDTEQSLLSLSLGESLDCQQIE